MKKRIFALFMAVIMCVCSSATAFAAEAEDVTSNHAVSDEQVVAEFDIEIDPETMDDSGIMPLADVDDTFYVYNGSHTGSTRRYYGNRLKYTATISTSNGGSSDNILAIQLYDNTDFKISEDQFWVNRAANVITDIHIISGNQYYFKYVIAYGTVRTIKIHMVITAYNA